MDVIVRMDSETGSNLLNYVDICGVQKTISELMDDGGLKLQTFGVAEINEKLSGQKSDNPDGGGLNFEQS